MATKLSMAIGRFPLSRVLEQLENDDAVGGPFADGSDDDLGMDSDYDYNSDSSVEGTIIIIIVQGKHPFK